MGEHHPVEARVEVDGVVKFQWKKDEGYLIDEIDKETITSRYLIGMKSSLGFW
jgi:hypothetical protein